MGQFIQGLAGSQIDAVKDSLALSFAWDESHLS